MSSGYRRLALSIAALFVLLLAGAVAVRAQTNLLVNPGFETPESTFSGADYPSTPGDWDGDVTTIVTAENGITPRSGSNMLHFINTGHVSSCGLVGSETAQLVDVTAFTADIAAGQVVASASVWFNRVAGDAQTDTEFLIRIIALDGSPNDFPTKYVANNWLAKNEFYFFTDGDPSTWESLSGELLLPCGTTYVAVWIAAVENVFDDCSGPEFDGHYADDVSLTIETGQCRNPGKSALTLKNKSNDAQDAITWSWLKGDPTDKTEFGNPTLDTTYSLCVSSANGAFARFVVPAGPRASRSAPGWVDRGTRGYVYRDKNGTSTGVKRVALKPTTRTKASVRFRGKGLNVHMPDLGTLLPPVKIGLQNNSNGTCWGAEFSTPTRSTSEVWRAKYTAP